MVGLGNIKFFSYYAQATQYYQEALSISRECFGTKNFTVARCLHNLGVTSLDRGHYDDAERFLEDALAIQVEICEENNEQVAISLCNLGRLHLKCAGFEKARHFTEKTLNIRLEIGNEFRIGRSLHHLGTLSETEGNITTAADYYRLALQMIRRY